MPAITVTADKISKDTGVMMNSGVATLVPTSLIPYLFKSFPKLNFSPTSNYTPNQSTLPDIGLDFFYIVPLKTSNAYKKTPLLIYSVYSKLK